MAWRVWVGGDGGIRTLDTGFSPYAPLAGECLRPLGHVSSDLAKRTLQTVHAHQKARRLRLREAEIVPGRARAVRRENPLKSKLHFVRCPGSRSMSSM